VEALGARALPVRVDVRDAEQVENVATRTLERFGRIDLLVNNAGALYWAGVLDTPPKRFDLVMGVNDRAALLCCRAVLPAMIRQGGGHVVNMSPPLDPSILPGRVAYGISKLGMTLLTVGLEEEVRQHNVAVNSLWPVTVIESQASINHRLGTPAVWRKPDILVDCVLRLARKEPAEMTARFSGRNHRRNPDLSPMTPPSLFKARGVADPVLGVGRPATVGEEVLAFRRSERDTGRGSAPPRSG
jgi:citronellol/citronellal dehydrogenase